MSFPPDSPPPIPPHPARRPPLKALLIPLAAAAVMILALMIFIQIPADEAPKSSSKPSSAPQPPSPPKPPPVPAAPAFPVLLPRPAAHAAAELSLALPMHTGSASLAWISRSIRENRKRPPTDVVRLEEILNQFPLRPVGSTAVSQGITLSTEAISCPWKPSASLLLISFRGASDGPREITASFKPDPSNVKRYRLLGFAPADDSALSPAPEPTPARLPAKSIISLVIEIETSTATASLGSIDWAVNQQACSPLILSRQTAAEPSDDARFAALVCTYAQWLTDERPGLINADILAALAREVASQTLPASRLDFLNLIDQSLRL